MENIVVKDVKALRKKSTDVTSASEAKDIIKKLEEALEKLPNGVGLAAVQIGIPKRVGVIKALRGKPYKYIYLINPQLDSKGGDFTFLKEGCLSFPNRFLNTKRCQDYTISNQRISNGEFHRETLSFYYEDGDVNSDGVVAIAVQHEMDHFDGKLIIDSDADQSIKPEPIQKDKKVGRNEPCPCGSGKKYKKCCLVS